MMRLSDWLAAKFDEHLNEDGKVDVFGGAIALVFLALVFTAGVIVAFVYAGIMLALFVLTFVGVVRLDKREGVTR